MWYSADRPGAVDAVLRVGFRAYYRWAALLNRLLPRVRDGDVVLRLLPGVYRPLYAESRAAEICEPGEQVLEIGCGSGIVSLAAARRGCAVTAVDISEAALANTRLNAERLGAADLAVHRSDMFSGVSGMFDVILAHPPYIRLRLPGAGRQWGTSEHFLETLVTGAGAHLRPNGRLGVIYVRSQRERLQRLAADHGLAVVSSRSFGRAPWAQRLLRLPYLNVGFGVTFFVLTPGGGA